MRRASGEVTGRRTRAGHRGGESRCAWQSGCDLVSLVVDVGHGGNPDREDETADSRRAGGHRGHAGRQRASITGDSGRCAKQRVGGLSVDGSAVTGLRVKLRQGSLREALLRSDKRDGSHLRMHKNLYGIRCDRVGRDRDISRGVRQAVGGGQGIRLATGGVVGDAAAGVTVPCAGADVAAGRDVYDLVVGRAVLIGAGAGRIAFAVLGLGRARLLCLPEGQRDARGPRLQIDGGHFPDLQPITQAIAVVRARVAGAAGYRNPGWYGQAQQANKRQEPPHESSPPRLFEPRSGLSEYARRTSVIAARQHAQGLPVADGIRSNNRPPAICSSMQPVGETLSRKLQRKVYQDGVAPGSTLPAGFLAPLPNRLR